MHLSVNATYFKKRINAPDRTVEEALRLCAEGGFRHFDLSCEDREEAARLGEFCALHGLSVGQSHIPYNRYKKADYGEFSARMMQAAACAAEMSSPILVVHGDEFDFGAQEFTLERGLAFNRRLFSPLVDFAAKKGMRVAFENVFLEEKHKDTYRFCAKTEELMSLVESFPADLVGICWDSGHAMMSYGDGHIAALSEVAHRVIATHIHDNYSARDLHLPPFMGRCNWPAFMDALRGGGYEGNLSLELHYGAMPEDISLEWVRWLYRLTDRLSKY
ncbi:MAG: sugar phosphate isomerase/epimerase [Clostridia bacterium]|nr:sugar phosphate isomerase/epimerase [Clostridia bacterium]